MSGEPQSKPVHPDDRAALDDFTAATGVTADELIAATGLEPQSKPCAALVAYWEWLDSWD